MSFFIVLFACCSAIVQASPLVKRSSLTCMDTTFTNIQATATNVAFPTSVNLAAVTASQIASLENVTYGAPNNVVSATFNVSARYCLPGVHNASRANTLQILVHGIGYDKNYWSGLSAPVSSTSAVPRSYVDYASSQGYPTLSIDRICNGGSSKANGTAICQIPMNTEIMHQIIQQGGSGANWGGGGWGGGYPGWSGSQTTTSNIVFVGHSTGSMVGNYLAQRYPSDVSAYILTGFTPFEKVGGLGTLVVSSVKQAAAASARFNTITDPTYYADTNQTGALGTLYYGSYTASVAATDWSTRGTLTTGELLTLYLGQQTASGVTVPVAAINGANDQIFCSQNIYDPLQGFKGNCNNVPGQGNNASATAAVRSLFPNAKTFFSAQTPSTGHSLQLHDTYATTFASMQAFLNSIGL